MAFVCQQLSLAKTVFWTAFLSFALLGSPSYAAINPDKEFVDLDFSEPRDIIDLVKLVSDWTNKNVILDKRVMGKVQILVSHQMTKREAYEAFLSALDSLGFTVLETGQVIKILPKREGLNSTAPITPMAKVDYSDKVYTQLFDLKEVSPDFAKNLISKLISSLSVIYFEQTNVLIVTETGLNLKKIAELLSLLQQSNKSDYQVVQLKNIRVNDAEPILKQLFGGTKPVRFVMNEANNSIFIVGAKEQTKSVLAAIANLDQGLQKDVSSAKLFVRPLSFGDAKKVATTLTAIVPEKKEKGTDKIHVTADEPTNSLLINADPQAYKSLNSIVRRLDAPRAQVLVETDIVSVDETHKFGFLPSLFGGYAKSDGSGTKTIVGFEAMRMAPLIVAQASTPTSATVASAIAPLGQDMTIGVFPGQTVDVPGIGKITPGGLLTMMTGDTYGRSLASPKILVVDNEEANFSAGQMYAYRTTDVSSTGGVTAKIEKEDITLNVKLKPNIGAAEALSLQVEIEASTIAGFAEDGTPQIAKKKARQLVNLKNGQTILISGIRNSSRRKVEKRVPFLGSVPVIGYLFSSNTTETLDGNLMIFMTAHIVRDVGDLKSLYEKRIKNTIPNDPSLSKHLSKLE